MCVSTTRIVLFCHAMNGNSNKNEYPVHSLHAPSLMPFHHVTRIFSGITLFTSQFHLLFILPCAYTFTCTFQLQNSIILFKSMRVGEMNVHVTHQNQSNPLQWYTYPCDLLATFHFTSHSVQCTPTTIYLIECHISKFTCSLHNMLVQSINQPMHEHATRFQKCLQIPGKKRVLCTAVCEGGSFEETIEFSLIRNLFQCSTIIFMFI